MATIHVLDNKTIDKIAAGEVVERPASVVKELVENAIDAKATSITVEIKDGGTTLIRVTDDGQGIEKSQIRNAFLRHATSKITDADDLTNLVSLGFRGEALASIAAVSMVEVISKTSSELTGIRYLIEGGTEKSIDDIGAPDGTTILIRNLFYNTPPRKKFLKTAVSEGNAVTDLMEHLCMSHPEIAFQYIINNKTRMSTSGNGNLKDIIYRIYGKDITDELMDFHYEEEGLIIDGYLGKPVINRANRNQEIFFINRRYIKSILLCNALEEGYRGYVMQHKFPFCVLHFTIDTQLIDVNVHPTKMEVRIFDAVPFQKKIMDAVQKALQSKEFIPAIVLADNEVAEKKEEKLPEPFEKLRKATLFAKEENDFSVPIPDFVKKRKEEKPVICEKRETSDDFFVEDPVFDAFAIQAEIASRESGNTESPSETITEAITKTLDTFNQPTQLNLFEEKLLSEENRKQYKIIGQIFDTYWIIVFQDKMMIVDQHAAHEKVKYERFMKHFKEHSIVSQSIMPPIVVTLSSKEQECYLKHMEDFEALGFEIEEFGGNDYSIRGVPLDLYGHSTEELFYDIIDELADDNILGTPESIRIRIATMACKAAVKGNSRMSLAEINTLLDELLALDNPYHCPHGRPTIVSMSRQEIEKKFKRIVD